MMSAHRGTPPVDLDASRRAVADAGLIADASAHLTTEVAMQLPFEALAPFKTMLKRFFSTSSWDHDDADELDALVRPHVEQGWWEHDLDSRLTLLHGIDDDHYHLWVTGGGVETKHSVFDRIFTGPVVPEATPHPKKVRFTIGGTPSPGIWHLRDSPVDDPRVRRLFEEPDVTDVMVAGDFVTVGIERTSSWELRLDAVLALVTELFADDNREAAPTSRTRDELLAEGRSIEPSSRSDDGPIHLADPDLPADQERLQAAALSDDARLRRIAVVILAETEDAEVRREALRRGAADPSLIVRRAAVDAAADLSNHELADLFLAALDDRDAWLRWKAVRSLGDLDPSTHQDRLRPLTNDPDFQVRFEVARVLRNI